MSESTEASTRVEPIEPWPDPPEEKVLMVTPVEPIPPPPSPESDVPFTWPEGWPDPRGNPFSPQYEVGHPLSVGSLRVGDKVNKRIAEPVCSRTPNFLFRFVADVWGGVCSIATDIRIAVGWTK